MKQLIATLRHILSHPLNRDARLVALKRYVRWQIGSRLVPGPVMVPFINGTQLVMAPGMTGATQHHYTGLHEFADCGFLLHLLRPEDLFVDIGSNVGVFTVLAVGAIGASAVAIEPVPETFKGLELNLRANDLTGKVQAHNIGLGSSESILRFTTGMDTTNHVITDETYSGPSIDVPVRTLDTVLAGRVPLLIKIDVEGWESEVLAGALQTLADPALLALIVEMDGSQASFNPNEQAVHSLLLQQGFQPCSYDPLTRSLTGLPSKNVGAPNTLYCRQLGRMSERLLAAPPFRANGRAI